MEAVDAMSLGMTYAEYRAAVVAEIMRQTAWPEADASNVAGDVDEGQAEGLSPAEAASEILHAYAEDSL